MIHIILICDVIWFFFRNTSVILNNKASPFKNYLYIPEFLENAICHQISQKHISSNELDYMHFRGSCNAWSIKLRLEVNRYVMLEASCWGFKLYHCIMLEASCWGFALNQNTMLEASCWGFELSNYVMLKASCWGFEQYIIIKLEASTWGFEHHIMMKLEA